MSREGIRLIKGQEEKLAALLADPEGAGGLAQELAAVRIGETTDLSALLGILAANKVPLLAIEPRQGPLQAGLCAHPVFQAAQAAERSHHDQLLREYLAARGLWQRAGIEDILIKSDGAFPYKTSNLDVLVRAQDGDRARWILRANGYIELRNVEENHKYLFRRFHQGQGVIGLHVHEHVGWYASFLDEKRLWERRRRTFGNYELVVPSAEDILLVTLAHFFYEDKEVKLADLATVHRCSRGGPLDWEYIWSVAAQRGWLDGLLMALLICAHLGRAWYGETPLPPAVLSRAEGELPPADRRRLRRYLAAEPLRWPFRIPFALSKLYFYRRLWRNRERPLAGRLADLAIHTLQGIKLRLRLHSQPAMLIAFSGIDGSGKSAQAQLLQKAFQGCHIRALCVWSRSGSSRFVGIFTRLARGSAFRRSRIEPISPDDESRISRRKHLLRKRAVRVAWLWLTALDLAVRYLLRVRLSLWRGTVVICDRYVLDAWAEWAAYLGIGAGIRRSLAARFLRWLSPRPHFMYLLDPPVEMALARATSAPPASFLAEEAEAYRQLAALFAATVKDAGRPLAELSDEIAYEVLTAYFDRYWTLLNALFFRNPRPLPALYLSGKEIA